VGSGFESWRLTLRQHLGEGRAPGESRGEEAFQDEVAGDGFSAGDHGQQLAAQNFRSDNDAGLHQLDALYVLAVVDRHDGLGFAFQLFHREDDEGVVRVVGARCEHGLSLIEA
jgi:hypothetical protein